LAAVELQRQYPLGAPGDDHPVGVGAVQQQLAGVRIAKKTVDRLRQLIWLAAQDVKAELAGQETYEYQKLAALVGVTLKNWSETFTERWEEMKTTLRRLDSDSLLQVTRSRSQQKATNLDSSLAKLD
jgi:hypothetical protein